MKIRLPKTSRGYVFDRLFAIEMNSFDVEGLLGALFYLIITRGRQRAGRVNDSKAVNQYLDLLAEHPRMDGFDDNTGRRLLAGWVRSSIASMGQAGRGRRGGEQIEFVLPLTILTYKTGLPTENSRQRNVNVFLYRILRDTLAWAGAEPNADAALTGIMVRAFGRGVEIGSAPQYDGRYDGSTELDLHSLLCLNYLDGFKPTPASKKEPTEDRPGEALPRVARGIGRDVLQYVTTYYERMPPLALTRGLLALIAFEIFVYTLKLVYATNALIAERATPAGMRDEDNPSLPSLYVDFTRQRGSTSDDMARSCVERDLEELRSFFDSALRLRTLHRFVEGRPQVRERLATLRTPEYLRALVELQANDPTVEFRAESELESIQTEITADATDGDREDLRQLFGDLERRHPTSALDRLLRLLAVAQQKNAITAYVQWYWSIGGLRKPFGLLDGTTHGRRNWRYAMKDDLLAAVVHLAFAEDPSQQFREPSIRPRIRLTEFLHFLESRFGVIVDRPPSMMDSAAHHAAAKENLEALRHRLHQMGFFEELSDDFTAQYLRNPMAQEVKV
jgi:hypothetical protein